MKTSTLKKDVEKILRERDDVLFAYIHGSALSSKNPKDIDVAIYLAHQKHKELVDNGEASIGFAIPMEMDLERRFGSKFDVQILNSAPLSFRYQVVTHNILVIDKDSNARSDFEYLTRVEYFDFRPRLDEYLQEVII